MSVTMRRYALSIVIPVYRGAESIGELVDDALVDVENVLLDTIARSGLEPGEIDAVVKTGGSSNIPLFTEMLTRIFGAEKVKASNSFTSVVAGLAIKAKM